MAEYNLRDLIEKAKKAKEGKKPAVAEKAQQNEKIILPAQSGKKKEEELAKKLKMLDKSLSEKVEVPKQKKTEPVPEEIAELAEPEKKPTVEQQMANMEKTQIAAYGNTRIYKITGMPLLYYYVPVPRPTASERAIINTIKEAATRLISIAPYKIRDQVQRRNVYHQKIMEIFRASPELRIPEGRMGFYADAVVREMVGYGLIDELVQDDKLEEIMVIGSKKPVYVFHRQYEMMFTSIEFYSDNEIQDLINKIAREVGRRVDISAPLLDARLPDGSRVNATIPPATVSGSTLTIRKFKLDPYSMVDLITSNTLTSEVAAFLWLCVDGMGSAPANILISGGTGSGKTTTLNVLASFIPERERIVSIEDTAELNLPLKHWIRMEARPPGLEGRGEITLDILTKNSLRMRPDRVIVGEVRHDEAFTLFTAMNTGHDGMASEDALIQFSDGSIKKLGSFCEEYFGKLETKRDGNIEFAELENDKPEIVAINKENLAQQSARVKTVWRRECQKSFVLKMASGKTIKVSYDHPVFRLKDGFLQQVQSHECEQGDYLCVLNSININGKKFNKEYAYFLGLLLGDGHLRRESVYFENKNKTLQDIFQKLTKKIFGKKTKICKREDGRMTSRLHSVKISSEIHEKFDVPFGNKTKIFDIPKTIEEADNESVGFFLRGMFDTDGHASDIRKSVMLATSNQNTAKKVPLLLKRFGIESRLYCQEKDGRNNFGPYYRVFITGESNLKKFKNFVGFGHPKKARILKSIIGVKENTNIDVVPGAGSLIKSVRGALGITQKELAFKTGRGNTRTNINAYETNARNPSRNALRKINAVLISEFNKKTRKLNRNNPDNLFESITKNTCKNAIKIAFRFAKKFSTIEKLQKISGFDNKLLYYYLRTGAAFEKEKLAEAIRCLHHSKTKELAETRKLITHINSTISNNIRWDRIVEISQKDEKTSYYDLTLDKFNTFVADGVIVSNCMGTIHANSPQETVVRVTSPPMNVPEIMLSGLDLIIIEHRIHDKKKGTIRRITEIAELTGVLEGKAQTQTIFERNPVNDTIERTNIPSNYLKKIETFTGQSRKQVETELAERKRFLDELAKKNIRSMPEVSKLAQDYLLSKGESNG